MDEPTVLPVTVRLGIPGLPNLTDSLVSGGVYLLIAETASARFPILAASLANVLAEQTPCTLVLPQDPEVFTQRLESFGNLSVTQSCATEQFKLFVMQEEFSKKMFRYGAEAFVQELDYYTVPDASYLLFDQADDLLSLHDVVLALDQLSTLRKWAQQRQVTLLLILTRTTDAHTGTINALMDQLSGIARLGAKRDGLELSFDYWQSPDGTIAGRNFLLSTQDDGLYQVMASKSESTSAEAEADSDWLEEPQQGDAQFFFMDPDLGNLAQQMPGKWQRVDTLVGMMHATRNLRSATCILVFRRDTNLRQLAEAVHTLRLSMGKYARIVVQEKEASLRYQNEALLLKLGLSLAINRDVAISRFPLLLDSLKGQIFNRDVDINFEAALDSVVPTHLSGYQLPVRFAHEIEIVLERAETLSIPCALMIGKPALNLTMLDIITNNGISRPGDLITASNDDCFIFLNACPQTALLEALERVLRMPVEAVLPDVRFVVKREEIQAELAALLHSAERENLPDYTSVAAIKATEPPAAPAKVQAVPTTRAPTSTTGTQGASAPAWANANQPDTPARARPVIGAGDLPAPMVTQRRPAPEPVAPDAAVLPTGAGAEPEFFQYDGISNVKVFGRTDAPRAKRANLADH